MLYIIYLVYLYYITLHYITLHFIILYIVLCIYYSCQLSKVAKGKTSTVWWHVSRACCTCLERRWKHKEPIIETATAGVSLYVTASCGLLSKSDEAWVGTWPRLHWMHDISGNLHFNKQVQMKCCIKQYQTTGSSWHLPSCFEQSWALVRTGSRGKAYRSVNGVPVALLLAFRSMGMMLVSLGMVSCRQGR